MSHYLCLQLQYWGSAAAAVSQAFLRTLKTSLCVSNQSHVKDICIIYCKKYRIQKKRNPCFNDTPVIWYSSHWQRKTLLEVLIQIKLQQEILRTAGIFSSLHSKFSQKYSLQILQNHGNNYNACSVTLHALSFYVFLAQIRKYVWPLLIFAISANTAHLCFSRQSRPLPVWLWTCKLFADKIAAWLVQLFLACPPIGHEFRGRHFGKLCFCTDECAAKVESLNV